MTSPTPDTPDVNAPELVGVGAQTIVDRSQALGLTWARKIAEVQSGDDPTACLVIFDGDTAAVSVVSMIGKLTNGDRVYVDTVPPSANFITGLASPAIFPRGLLGYNALTADSGAIGGVETVWATTGTVVFPAGRAFRFRAWALCRVSVSNQAQQVSIRKVNAAGTLLIGPIGFECISGIDHHPALVEQNIINITGTDITTTICATIRVAAGGGTVIVGATANKVSELEIVDCGRADDYPNAIGIS
jgi:hypothetical protein